MRAGGSEAAVTAGVAVCSVCAGDPDAPPASAVGSVPLGDPSFFLQTGILSVWVDVEGIQM